MKRRDFVKSSIIGVVGLSLLPTIGFSSHLSVKECSNIFDMLTRLPRNIKLPYNFDGVGCSCNTPCLIFQCERTRKIFPEYVPTVLKTFGYNTIESFEKDRGDPKARLFTYDHNAKTKVLFMRQIMDKKIVNLKWTNHYHLNKCEIGYAGCFDYIKDKDVVPYHKGTFIECINYISNYAN